MTQPVRLTVPLLSADGALQTLAMLAAEAQRLCRMLDTSREPDHNKLIVVRAELRVLNQRINAYRWPANELRGLAREQQPSNAPPCFSSGASNE